MNTVEKAIDIARQAHRGQTDKLGQDYIHHPLRVHQNLLSNPKFLKLDALAREDCEVAALLHDVIEDSGGGEGSKRFTKEDLLREGFSVRSVELIDALTRKPEVPADHYYAAIEADPLAKLVKHADIADNRNKGRVAKLSVELQKKLGDKYRHALEIIRMDEDDEAWFRYAIDFEIDLDNVDEESEEEQD